MDFPSVFKPAVTLTTTAQVIDSANCEVRGMLFCNRDTAQHTITITDAAGKYFFKGFAIPAGLTFEVDWFSFGRSFAGGCMAWADANDVIDASFTVTRPLE
jgi:hypothetical protein